MKVNDLEKWQGRLRPPIESQCLWRPTWPILPALEKAKEYGVRVPKTAGAL
jgi:hypothetical protein